MQLSDVSVRRPVFAAVIAILIAVIGLVGFSALSVREYPDVDPPIVSVQTVYTGVEGLQTITSRSRDGQSEITIEFAPGRSVDDAANDVRDRIGGAARDLPE